MEPSVLHAQRDVLGNMAAFKAHCSFGFWGAEMTKVLATDGVLQDGGMGSLGRIESVKDLPSDKAMLGYIRQAVELVDTGQGGNRFTMARRAAKAPEGCGGDSGGVCGGFEEEQGGGEGFRGVQPKLQAGVCGVDRGCQARGDSGTPHCAGGGVDRGGEAAELEVYGVLKEVVSCKSLVVG